MSTLDPSMSAEEKRLVVNETRTENWKRWGPYLSERQWGTVREDYSANSNPWEFFPHDHARSRAYRWGEDGLLGICDRQCRLCFSLALWNGKDSILKERLFGLTGPQGNHGEDVKEFYYYLDSTPTHSWMKALYKYPQSPFPYEGLVEKNKLAGRDKPEFELADTGIFDESRYFDVFVSYAKASAEDLLIEIEVINRGPEAAPLHLLPTLWFRNTWSWGRIYDRSTVRPRMSVAAPFQILAEHITLGDYAFLIDPDNSESMPELLFTENETNLERLFKVPNMSPWVKDAFHRYLIQGETGAVNAEQIGTKVCAVYKLKLAPGESKKIRLRLKLPPNGIIPLTNKELRQEFGTDFEQVMTLRRQEADEFYGSRFTDYVEQEAVNVARQASAGLLWSKQFYYYSVREWLTGDENQPVPPRERLEGRNNDWQHIFNRDIISMPDKWEYPWYAAWDLAFHMLPMAEIDPEFAKSQLLLFMREWYMHPSGQIPAYEFNFCDVNPPVHAWACWRVYKITAAKGERDLTFLKRAFHKLILNFTWWVNRKDPQGKNLFAGGFLGLDNIGVFDRSQSLPTGGHLEQADGTAWMAFFCGTMLSIALEIATYDNAYEDVASKFFEHFVAIADAMNSLGGTGLWDEEDGFYYDRLMLDGRSIPLRTRSIVGLVPMFAVEILEDHVIKSLPGFRDRMNWFLRHRPDLADQVAWMVSDERGSHPHGHRLLAIPSRKRLERILHYLLSESEFLSKYGIRSLSKFHGEHPYVFRNGNQAFSVAYTPGESDSGMFGGNSNWRGPIWFPMNYLMIEALERYYHFYGDDLLVEYPTGSGTKLNLRQVADKLARRLCSIFMVDKTGRRPCHGQDPRYWNDPNWKNLVLFYEYFHGDDGRGCGASHQTGWTALVTRFLHKMNRYGTRKK